MKRVCPAQNVSKTFGNIPAPWLNQVIERKPQSFLRAVSDVSFDIRKGTETLALVGDPAAASPPSRPADRCMYAPQRAVCWWTVGTRRSRCRQ